MEEKMERGHESASLSGPALLTQRIHSIFWSRTFFKRGKETKALEYDAPSTKASKRRSRNDRLGAGRCDCCRMIDGKGGARK